MKVKENVQWACHPCISGQMRKHLATKLHETQKPGIHAITTSDKNKDSAATAVGQSFLLVNLSKKEINLYKGMIIGIMPYLVLGS